jgi:hypothetical protein
VTVVLSIPAGRPKRDIIELAFDDCGLAGYEFDRTPEEQSMALRKLNALMLEHPWNQLGYTQPAYGVGLAEEPSGLPDDTINAVAQYLALRIAPGIGNTLSPEQRSTMARSLMQLQSQYAVIPSMDLTGSTVRGTGTRLSRFWPFTGRR